MRYKIASLCLITLLGSIASPFAAQKTLKGIPAQVRAEGMLFIELNDKTGEQIMVIGAPYEFEKNQAALDCLERAATNDQMVILTGEWEDQGEGMFGFVIDTLKCVAESQPAPIQQTQRNNLNAMMSIKNGLNGQKCYSLQSREDSPFQVSGFEINRGNFQYHGNKTFPPFTLKFGESRSLFCVFPEAISHIIEVQVMTSLGTFTYNF